jgi:hypothetical protein
VSSLHTVQSTLCEYLFREIRDWLKWKQKKWKETFFIHASDKIFIYFSTQSTWSGVPTTAKYPSKTKPLPYKQDFILLPTLSLSPFSFQPPSHLGRAQKENKYKIFVRFEVFTAVRTLFIWILAPCRQFGTCQRSIFRTEVTMHYHDVYISKTLTTTEESKWCKNPEQGHGTSFDRKNSRYKNNLNI